MKLSRRQLRKLITEAVLQNEGLFDFAQSPVLQAIGVFSSLDGALSKEKNKIESAVDRKLGLLIQGAPLGTDEYHPYIVNLKSLKRGLDINVHTHEDQYETGGSPYIHFTGQPDSTGRGASGIKGIHTEGEGVGNYKMYTLRVLGGRMMQPQLPQLGVSQTFIGRIELSVGDVPNEEGAVPVSIHFGFGEFTPAFSAGSLSRPFNVGNLLAMSAEAFKRENFTDLVGDPALPTTDASEDIQRHTSLSIRGHVLTDNLPNLLSSGVNVFIEAVEALLSYMELDFEESQRSADRGPGSSASSRMRSRFESEIEQARDRAKSRFM